MSSRPNPLSVQLFADPRLREIDQQYLQARQAALTAAQHVSPAIGGSSDNQADAAGMRNSYDKMGIQFNDYTSYPADQSILNLPQANAAAQARRTASIAMMPPKKGFTL